MYADDVVNLAPSREALQQLIDICEEYGTSNDIIFNVDKTTVMVFECKLLKGVVTYFILDSR